MGGFNIEHGMRADVVIVGGGLAGLVAGIAASAKGASVLVLERGADERYRCNSRFAGGAFHVAYTDPESPAVDLLESINRVTAGEVQSDLAHAIAENAGRAMHWLAGQGIDFAPGPTPMHKWMLSPHRPMLAGMDWPDHGPDRMMKTLGARLEAAGGTFARGCRALQLRMDNERCIGLRVRRAEAECIDVDASAVLLADGGFQANDEMVGRYISKRPQWLVQRNAGTANGDGIQMAATAGADLVSMERFYGHLLAREALTDDGFSPYPQIDPVAAVAMVVDGTGARFVDEGCGGINIANVVARFDDPRTAFTIFDDRIWREGVGVTSVYPINPTLERCGATVFRAATPAALAAQIGVDPQVLTETVETYNRAVSEDQGETLTIPRTGSPAPLDANALMAVAMAVGITNTMGGIVTDAQMRVQRRGGGHIGALYAAGGTTGGLEGGGTIGYVGGLIKALVTGLLAGESMA